MCPQLKAGYTFRSLNKEIIDTQHQAVKGSSANEGLLTTYRRLTLDPMSWPRDQFLRARFDIVFWHMSLR